METKKTNCSLVSKISKPGIMMGLTLAAILAFSVLIKLPLIGEPFVGNFAGYQEGYASIAKYYLVENFRDIFHPKLFALMNGEPGLRMLDFPVSSMVAALGKFLLGGSMELWGRLQAILFSTGSTFLLFLLVRRLFSGSIALVSALAFILSPLTLIYGRSFLNESGAIFFTITSLYFITIYLDRKTLASFMLSATAFAIAVVMRIQCLYLALPIGLLFLSSYGLKIFFRFRVYLFFIVSLALPAAWYAHTYWVSRTSDHVFMSLFFQASVYLAKQKALIFEPEFYVRLFDDFSGIVLNPLGFTFFLIGLFILQNRARRGWFAWGWLATLALTVFVIPKKYFQHNFYLWHFVPICSIFIGNSVIWLFEKLRENLTMIQKWGLGILLLVVAMGCSLRFAIHPAFVIPPQDRERLDLVHEVLQIIPEDAKVIASDQGSYAFLAYFERMGWPFAIPPKDARQEVPFYVIQQMKSWPEAEKKRVMDRYADPMSWIEYLRGQGAEYLIVSNRKNLEGNKIFREYLDAKYPKIPLKNQAGVLYHLGKQNA